MYIIETKRRNSDNSDAINIYVYITNTTQCCICSYVCVFVYVYNKYWKIYRSVCQLNDTHTHIHMHTYAFTYGAFDNFISKVLLLGASEMAIVTNSVRVAKLTVAVMLCACPVLSVCMADLEFAQGVFVSRACAHTHKHAYVCVYIITCLCATES